MIYLLLELQFVVLDFQNESYGILRRADNQFCEWSNFKWETKYLGGISNMFDVLDKSYFENEDFLELWNGLPDYKKELLNADEERLMKCFNILDENWNGL